MPTKGRWDLTRLVKVDSHIGCRSHGVPRLSTAVLCCALEKNGMVGAWHGHGMVSVNQTRPHGVDQMGKTYYKPLGARHGRGTAWARDAMCASALSDPPAPYPAHEYQYSDPKQFSAQCHKIPARLLMTKKATDM